MNFSLRRFLFFLKEHSELCDLKKGEKIPRKNIKHAKVLIVTLKNYLNGEFIEVPLSIKLEFFFFHTIKTTADANVKATPITYDIIGMIWNPSGAMHIYVVTTHVMKSAGSNVTK